MLKRVDREEVAIKIKTTCDVNRQRQEFGGVNTFRLTSCGVKLLVITGLRLTFLSDVAAANVTSTGGESAAPAI